MKHGLSRSSLQSARAVFTSAVRFSLRSRRILVAAGLGALLIVLDRALPSFLPDADSAKDSLAALLSFLALLMGVAVASEARRLASSETWPLSAPSQLIAQGLGVAFVVVVALLAIGLLGSTLLEWNPWTVHEHGVRPEAEHLPVASLLGFLAAYGLVICAWSFALARVTRPVIAVFTICGLTLLASFADSASKMPVARTLLGGLPALASLSPLNAVYFNHDFSVGFAGYAFAHSLAVFLFFGLVRSIRSQRGASIDAPSGDP